MTRRASEKISISSEYLNFIEDLFLILLKNERRLTVQRAVIDSPLGDDVLVEAVVVNFRKDHTDKEGTFVIQASAPLMSVSLHLSITEFWSLNKDIRKYIPRNGNAVSVIKEYVENFLDGFQTHYR